jgi:hypothetical protein
LSAPVRYDGLTQQGLIGVARFVIEMATCGLGAGDEIA